jgi:Protein of unknown function (DUF552).
LSVSDGPYGNKEWEAGKLGLKSKLKSWFYLDADDWEEEDDRPVSQADSKQRPANVVSIKSVQSTSRVILLEPRQFEDAQQIADHLKNRRAVVCNMQWTGHDTARRILDFLSGTVYAIGGEMEKIGHQIFLCVPDNMEVSGKITDLTGPDDER